MDRQLRQLKRCFVLLCKLLTAIAFTLAILALLRDLRLYDSSWLFFSSPEPRYFHGDDRRVDLFAKASCLSLPPSTRIESACLCTAQETLFFTLKMEPAAIQEFVRQNEPPMELASNDFRQQFSKVRWPASEWGKILSMKDLVFYRRAPNTYVVVISPTGFVAVEVWPATMDTMSKEFFDMFR